MTGLTVEQVGEAAAAHAIVLHELAPHQASLEEAFMDLTRDELEFAAGGDRRMTVVPVRASSFSGRVTQMARRRSRSGRSCEAFAPRAGRS